MNRSSPTADLMRENQDLLISLREELLGRRRLRIWEWDIAGVVTSDVEYPNLDYLELYKKKKELVTVYMDQAEVGKLGWVSRYYRLGGSSPSTGPYLSIRYNTETLVEKKYNQWFSGWR